MRVIIFISFLCAVQGNSQVWDYFQFLRQGKSDSDRAIPTFTPSVITTVVTTKPTSTTKDFKTTVTLITDQINENTGKTLKNFTTTSAQKTTGSTSTSSTVQVTTQTSTTPHKTTLKLGTTGGTQTEGTGSTFETEITTNEVTQTTAEPRDNSRTHEFYLKRDKPHIKIASNISQNLLPLPAGASAALVKPTKYHYYPHNQHIYLLPECAIQQVCNAVYVRLNWTQPLCACPSRYRDPCSASLNSDDQHTTELTTDRKSRKALTLVKTCEPTTEMRICRAPRDWSLLALQNIRTGKSHYLVICRCPDSSILEGPMSHDQPTYASVPGIRVYGMMCVDNKRRARLLQDSKSIESPPFPWKKALELIQTVVWD